MVGLFVGLLSCDGGIQALLEGKGRRDLSFIWRSNSDVRSSASEWETAWMNQDERLVRVTEGSQ